MHGMRIQNYRRHTSLAWSLAASAILLAIPAATRAQTVNYQQLEELFGEPVTTSVTGKPQRASEAPAALIIITREDIRRSPAKDIVGLVRAYAGVDVARWTAGQSDVSIRGGIQPFNARLLVLVNGQQVYLDYYGTTNWNGIGVQLEDIQQIEIVKGPNSALFGFNAVSGVINIITISPLQTQQLSMKAEAGTHGYAGVSASGALKLGDNAGLRLSGGYGESDELSRLGSSVFSAPSPARSLGDKHAEVAAELYGKLGEQTEAALSATYSDSRQMELPQVLTLFNAHYKFNSLGARVTHDAGWGVLSARVYQNRSDIDYVSAVFPGVQFVNPGFPGIQFHNTVLVGVADVLAPVGKSNTVRFGVEFRSNKLTTRPGYPGATHYDVLAANGMWEGALSDRVTFVLAGRLDHLTLEQQGVIDQPTVFTKKDFDRSITAWSFNSALLFKLDDSNSIRATLARGIQAPSLLSFASRVVVAIPGLPFPLVDSGNPDIRPTTIWNGEIGFTHAIGGTGGRLELNAFYNRTKDIISTGRGTGAGTPRASPPAYPFILTTSDNIGAFEAYGLEASLAGRVNKGLTWSMNYTWTKARQDIRGSTDTTLAWPVALDRTTPEHRLRGQLTYERGAWLGAVAARYNSGVQQLVAINQQLTLVDIDATIALDAKIAFQVTPKLSLEIAGDNLTDARGADFSVISAERRVRATVRARF